MGSPVTRQGLASSQSLILNYHNDIKMVSSPKIYRGNLSTDVSITESNCRRLIFYNLAPCIQPVQVARAAARFGQVVLVNTIAPVLWISHDTAQIMLIEFASARSAVLCAKAVDATFAVFLCSNGKQYKTGVWVIPTCSFPLSSHTQTCLDRGYSRTLKVSPVSIDRVWFIICAVWPPQDVLDADYDDASKTITVEFTGMAVAFDAVMRLREGLVDFVFHDSEDKPLVTPCPDRIAGAENMNVLPASHLPHRFDCEPYNVYWPSDSYYVKRMRNLGPRHLKRELDGSPCSTELGQDDDVAERLLVDTTDDPAMLTCDWESFSHNQQTISLQRWANYGRMAQHRRELSMKQGLGDGIIPECDGNCGFGCMKMKDSPPAEEVDRYRGASTEDLIKF